jgi:hypothetical protein
MAAIRHSLTDGTVEILHAEKMRGDLDVPPDRRQDSRFENWYVPFTKARTTGKEST